MRLSIGLMQAFSENKTDFSSLVVGLSGRTYPRTRLDLTEGKVHLPNSPHQQFSYPIICYISKNPEDHRLINILKQHTTKEELKLYAKKLLEESVVVVDGT